MVPARSRSWIWLGLLVLLALLSCLVAALVVHQPELPAVPIPRRPAG